jgi:Tfp pilus assembly protein PilW
MEFKPTSPRSKTSGFTLFEMLVAGLIGCVLIAGLAAFWLFSLTSFSSMTNYAELNQKDRIANDMLSRDLRQAFSISSASVNSLVLNSPGGNVTYGYAANKGTLTRSQGTNSQTLLTGVTSLNWTLYSRPATNATYNTFPTTTNVALAKLVSVQWGCSRTVSGTESDTKSMQTALIEMRNE